MQPGRRVTKVLVSRIVVETSTIDGDSPVDENTLARGGIPEYRGTREIP